MTTQAVTPTATQTGSDTPNTEMAGSSDCIVAPSTAGVLAVWRERVDYQGIILGLICAVVTVLLLLGDRGTHAMIAQRQMEDRLANLAQVMPPERYDNNPLQDAVLLADPVLSSTPVEVYPAVRDGDLQGVAFQVTTIGYGGVITLLLGLDHNGNILGVRVLSHKETPGLADKIEIGKGKWILSFDGASLANTAKPQWAVKKDGGQFDQFAGATITPRAIVNGVYRGLEFYTRHVDDIAADVFATGENTQEAVP